jgi:signal transduction histidine kinase
LSDAAIRVGAEQHPAAASFGARREPSKAASVLSGSRATPAMIAIGGGALAGAAGYLAAVGPRLSSGSAALVWVTVGVSVVALWLYAAAGRSGSRPGRVLAAAVVLWLVWLMLASGRPDAFTVGGLFAGLTVPILGYEMLAATTGGAFLRSERLVLLASSILVAVCWGYLALSARHVPVVSAMEKCLPAACPHNVLFVGTPLRALVTVAQEGLRAGWLVAAFAVAVFILRRYRAAGVAERRYVAPMLAVAIAYAVIVTICVTLEISGQNARAPLIWCSVITATVIPLAMLAGLVWERLFMGEALEEFVTRLRDTPPEDVRMLMAQMLEDPSLQIAYSQPAEPGYVDSSGTSVELPATDAEQAVTAVQDESVPQAVVIHRAAVPDEERFIRAAGAAAFISYENHRLEADLSATVVELAASRKRLIEAAYAERQRIERDLHDGIQQRIVSARVSLGLADDALDTTPARGRRMLAEIGCDLEDALEEVRALAQGVYPALLTTYGLLEALRSAARRAPGPVTVRGEVARYAPETEAAIYFCCLETLQNVAKHAGRDAAATVRLWEDSTTLCFQTRDSGIGFKLGTTPQGRGLVNMRDRLAAVGGTLTLSSRVGVGTVIRGCVPLD